VVRLHLDEDRAGTLEQLRRVLNQFAMPAVHLLADGRQRIEAVKALHIFDDEVYYQEVYLPILAGLEVDRSEMRHRVPHRKAAANVVIP
jgi:acyl-[acyl-carrier-protein] desaturase